MNQQEVEVGEEPPARYGSKDQVTVAGLRNWQTLVTLATRDQNDRTARRQMADALAALVSEMTPLHREVLASQYLTYGARGRVHTHPLPPGLQAGADPRWSSRWAALVLLDCVDHAGDMLAADHPLSERLRWRANAEHYTQGAENFARP